MGNFFHARYFGESARLDGGAGGGSFIHEGEDSLKFVSAPGFSTFMLFLIRNRMPPPLFHSDTSPEISSTLPTHDVCPRGSISSRISEFGEYAVKLSFFASLKWIVA